MWAKHNNSWDQQRKFFLLLPVFWLDSKEQYPSMWAYKDSGTLFWYSVNKKFQPYVFTEYSKCTASQSNKIVRARVAGAGTILMLYHEFMFAEHFAGKLQLISAEPCITLGVHTQSAYLKELLELQPNLLEIWTAPDRASHILLPNTVQINLKWILSEISLRN